MTASSEIDEQALRWFVSLREPDTAEEAWLAFQDWLEADNAHRLAYDRIEQVWLDCEEPKSAPETANDASVLSVARRKGAGRMGRWLLPVMGIAAAVVLAFGLVGRMAPLQTFHTGVESQTIVLDDGSRIVLNRHTELGVRMESGRRRVTMVDGEAAFDVAPDPDRPFVIAAGDQSVSVMGTAFNVLSHGGRFAVGVERGIVEVSPAHDRARVRLVAGQKLNQIGGGAPVLSRVDPAATAPWREGVLVYRDSSLSDVAFDLSRYLDKTVNVSPAARTLRFTGALKVSDEATMLRQLQDFAPVRVTRSGTSIDLAPRDDG